MNELTIQELIKAKFSGELSQSTTYINLTIQAVAVLIGGIILWRASNAVHKKKLKERKQNTYFQTTFSRHWKNR